LLAAQRAALRAEGAHCNGGSASAVLQQRRASNRLLAVRPHSMVYTMQRTTRLELTILQKRLKSSILGIRSGLLNDESNVMTPKAARAQASAINLQVNRFCIHENNPKLRRIY
jgi:hypothetical protein